MGLFDMFKKKDEAPKTEPVTANNEIAKAKEITVKFAYLRVPGG